MRSKYIIYSLISLLFLTSAAHAQSDTGNMLITAVMEYNEGKYEDAAATLKSIIDQDPSNDAAWYYLAMCSMASKDVEMAEYRFQKAVELDPDNFWYRYRLAGVYAMTSRADLTVDMYEKLLQDFPKKSDLYFDLAELYSAQKEYQKALDTLSEIEAVFGVTESVAVYRFNLLMQMQKQEEAYKSLEDYNNRYSSPYVLSTLAEHQLNMYNDSTALAYYNEALEVAPDYAPALLGKAETLRMTRKYGEYFSALNEFVSNESDVAKSKADYLSAVIQRSDPKFLRAFMPQMDIIVEKTLQVHPSDSTALNMAGLYYYATNRKDAAKGKFRENAQVNPASLAATASYVEFLMYTDEWKELTEEALSAYDRFSKEPTFLEMASLGYHNLNEYDKVLEISDRILEVAPSDSAKTLRAWSTKGDVYYQLGNAKKSFNAYEKALKINPDYVYVLNNYAYYLSVAGKNLKKALAMSRKTIEAEPDNATYLDTYGWILYLLGKAEDAKPHFKHAMLYGGKESSVILDHYAEVLFALGEYDRAMVYWNQAIRKNDEKVPGLKEKIEQRKQQMKKKTERK